MLAAAFNMERGRGANLSGPDERRAWLLRQRQTARGSNRAVLDELLCAAGNPATTDIPPAPARSDDSRVDQLWDAFRRFNARYFGGALPTDVRLSIHNEGLSQRTLGAFFPSCREIVLRPSLFAGLGTQRNVLARGLRGIRRLTEDVLLHELTHLVATWNLPQEEVHGRKWQAECRRVTELFAAEEKRPDWRRIFKANVQGWPENIRPSGYFTSAF